MPFDFRVATFNLRNTSDRYAERKALMGAAFVSMQADICGLQEVIFAEEMQADFLALQLPARNYQAFDARSGRSRDFGNAILCRIGEVQAHEELRLTMGRVAHRVLVVLPGNRTLWFANTHLHHRLADDAVREEQVRRILAWLDDAPRATANILAGDFNTSPASAAYRALEEAGYASAYRAVHGAEPVLTWPSGIQAPTIDTEGDPGCRDYIWVRGNLTVLDGEVAANEPAPSDAGLYPSDHFAIVATVRLD